MSKVAFFIDGNFLFKQMENSKSFYMDGENIKSYCERHLEKGESIYRIFYYDAPPLERIATTPLGEEIDFGKTDAAQNMKKRLDSIRETPHLALRLGKVAWHNDWIIKPKPLAKLMKGTITFDKLLDKDFFPNCKQKLVDMKIGLDIATVAFKKLADRIVLITGDSDFAPAAKLARMEGLMVVIDPMGKRLPSELIEHVDYVRTMLNVDNEEDVSPSSKRFFVENPKSNPLNKI